MGTKRAATTELNHENWNEENEPEEIGKFEKAPQDELDKRVIKAAKRRLGTKEESGKNAFGTFTGFKTTTTSSASPFSFLANTSTTVKSTTSTSNGASKSPENKSDESEKDTKIFKKSSDYFSKLKGLNEGVAQWIKTHVDANPFCILTPIFRDYERYLKEIETKHGNELDKTKPIQEQAQSNTDSIKSTKSVDDSASSAGETSKPFLGISSDWKPEKSIFGNISSNVDAQSQSSKSVFYNKDNTTPQKSIFGNVDTKTEGKNIFDSPSSEVNPSFLCKPFHAVEEKNEDKEDKNTVSTSFASPNTNVATFSFGQSSPTSTATAGFSFGSAKPFSFGAQVAKPQESEDKSESKVKDDDDEEPPKADFKPITEEGAVYEQRCKVFTKKDGIFTGRGVGTLFLKPTPNGKTQLIVRAETSLGNLLLNTLLTESIPVQRLNKNTIMLVCLPLPESQPPPTPVLLRVKTSEDADTLFETLNKYRK